MLFWKKKRKVIGWETTFHAMASFRDFIDGRITLEQYQVSRSDTETKPIYADEIPLPAEYQNDQRG